MAQSYRLPTATFDQIDPYSKAIGPDGYGYLRDRAAQAGTSVDDYIKAYQDAGWTIAPEVLAKQAEVNQSPAGQGNTVIGRPYSVEQAQALETEQIAQHQAEQDPAYKYVSENEEKWLRSLDPGTYDRYARQIGMIKPGVDPSQQQWGADQFRRLASGQDSVVARQTQLAREQLAHDAASQVASSRGGYNPALARSAIMARTQGSADLGAQGAIGQAMERQQALGRYMGAQGQTDDLRRNLAADRERRIGAQAAMSGMSDATASGLAGMRGALDDKYFNRYLSTYGQQLSGRTPQTEGPGPVENFLAMGGAITSQAANIYNMLKNKGGGMGGVAPQQAPTQQTKPWWAY